MTTITEIQNVAIHESGHATVAAYLGAPVSRIELWTARGGGFEGVVDCFLGDSTLFDNTAIVTAGHAAISLTDPACTFDGFAYGERGTWLADLPQAHSWINQISPAPSDKRRRKILREQWERSREIIRLRWAGVIALANALLTTYEAAEQCRAEISGAKLIRLLEFAK